MQLGAAALYWTACTVQCANPVPSPHRTMPAQLRLRRRVHPSCAGHRLCCGAPARCISCPLSPLCSLAAQHAAAPWAVPAPPRAPPSAPLQVIAAVNVCSADPELPCGTADCGSDPNQPACQGMDCSLPSSAGAPGCAVSPNCTLPENAGLPQCIDCSLVENAAKPGCAGSTSVRDDPCTAEYPPPAWCGGGGESPCDPATQNCPPPPFYWRDCTDATGGLQSWPMGVRAGGGGAGPLFDGAHAGMSCSGNASWQVMPPWIIHRCHFPQSAPNIVSLSYFRAPLGGGRGCEAWLQLWRACSALQACRPRRRAPRCCSSAEPCYMYMDGVPVPVMRECAAPGPPLRPRPSRLRPLASLHASTPASLRRAHTASFAAHTPRTHCITRRTHTALTPHQTPHTRCAHVCMRGHVVVPRLLPPVLCSWRTRWASRQPWRQWQPRPGHARAVRRLIGCQLTVGGLGARPPPAPRCAADCSKTRGPTVHAAPQLSHRLRPPLLACPASCRPGSAQPAAP